MVDDVVVAVVVVVVEEVVDSVDLQKGKKSVSNRLGQAVQNFITQ